MSKVLSGAVSLSVMWAVVSLDSRVCDLNTTVDCVFFRLGGRSVFLSQVTGTWSDAFLL